MLIERQRSQVLMVDIQERLLPAVLEPEKVVGKGALLLKAAAELAVPVIVSEQYPKGLGHTVPELSALVGANRAYEKVEFSCFANPTLREALGSPGRQTIIFGIEAHVCVLQTAFEMIASGSEVVVVADAVSSRGEQNRDLALKRLEKGGAHIVSAEMVLFEWLRRAGSESFRRISQLIR